ncbi:MAG TPA: LptF/LptG family permease, partial [bacterium]|nr:LptF/LptG family permease [bacterium]
MLRKRYMLVEFLAIYLAVNLSFLTLFLVIQVLTDLPQKMQAQAGLDWQSYLWQLPAIFVQISPMLTFVSSLFLLTEMMKRGELRILELGGILPLLVYDMLLLCGFLAALTVFWVNETLVPISYRHLKPARVVSGVHLSTPSFF